MSRLVLCLPLLALLAACDVTSTGEPAAAPKVSLFPRSAGEVTADSRWEMRYEGKATKIQYFVRTVSNDEAEQMPDTNLFKGDAQSWVFVPIKDGKIVEAPMSDVIGLGYAISQ